MPFIENTWYVAALASEVPASTALARRLLDRALVVFRDERGEPAVLDDRCPHRFAPLSRGQLAHGVITCRYHGLRFAADGRCVGNPHGDGRIPAGAHVRRYPSIERYGAIWFWPGEPARAGKRRLDVRLEERIDGIHVERGERLAETGERARLERDGLRLAERLGDGRLLRDPGRKIRRIPGHASRELLRARGEVLADDLLPLLERT